MKKLSRSKIDLFLECPRCFWLDVKKGVKRPPMFPYTINNAVDYLLKQEFDVYRERGEPHPVMRAHGIDAVPFAHEALGKWRHNFTGVQYEDKDTQFLVTGAVDDVWSSPEGELFVVDYKATGANQHQVHDSYKRQMEIYQWLLRRNNFEVSPVGYFVFARVNKGNGFSDNDFSPEENAGTLPFDLFIESYRGADDWVGDALRGARTAYDSDEPPQSSPECVYCTYRDNSSLLRA